MKLAIICSKKDPAGMNICRHLKELGVEKRKDFSLHVIEEDSIFAENLDKRIDADAFIFATKHRSSSGIKSLTVHVQGNWGKAEFGGEEGKIAVAAAPLIKSALKNLSRESIGYEVVQEVTHHGPFMEKPSMFIEIGSSEKEWSDDKAGEAIAKAILNLSVEECITAVGIGGLHYASNFMPIQLNTNIAIGHICPKYALADLNSEKLRQAIERTWPKKAELIIVDWKGLGGHKEKVKELLENAGIPWKKSSDAKHNL
ncbi:MAG: D-aminoacyl-tRNA deacylase [Candidatus Woesearchaeota archaeon]